MHFSRDQEVAADRFGAELVVRTYGHAAGISDFFATMVRERRDPRVLAWFSTHPATQWRIERLDELTRRRGWRVDPRQRLFPLATTCDPG